MTQEQEATEKKLRDAIAMYTDTPKHVDNILALVKEAGYHLDLPQDKELREKVFDLVTDPPCHKHEGVWCEFWDRQGNYCFLKDIHKNTTKCELLNQTLALIKPPELKVMGEIDTPKPPFTGVELITKERERQITQEGWTADHDDEWTSGALGVAGASYALDVAARIALANEREYWSDEYSRMSKMCFPFDQEWFKPTPKDDIRELTKAGALIAAEIDRLQRVAQAQLNADRR